MARETGQGKDEQIGLTENRSSESANGKSFQGEKREREREREGKEREGKGGRGCNSDKKEDFTEFHQRISRNSFAAAELVG